MKKIRKVTNQTTAPPKRPDTPLAGTVFDKQVSKFLKGSNVNSDFGYPGGGYMDPVPRDSMSSQNTRTQQALNILNDRIEYDPSEVTKKNNGRGVDGFDPMLNELRNTLGLNAWKEGFDERAKKNKK